MDLHVCPHSAIVCAKRKYPSHNEQLKKGSSLAFWNFIFFQKKPR